MLRFLDVIGRVLPRNRVSELCTAMQLTDEETYLFLERFAGGLTQDQCDKVSVQRQKFIVPYLDTKVQLFFDHDRFKEEPFFTKSEHKAILAEALRLRTKNKKILDKIETESERESP